VFAVVVFKFIAEAEENSKRKKIEKRRKETTQATLQREQHGGQRVFVSTYGLMYQTQLEVPLPPNTEVYLYLLYCILYSRAWKDKT
jgi:hypothetical protein